MPAFPLWLNRAVLAFVALLVVALCAVRLVDDTRYEGRDGVRYRNLRQCQLLDGGPCEPWVRPR